MRRHKKTRFRLAKIPAVAAELRQLLYPLRGSATLDIMARVTLRLDFGPGAAVGHGKIRLLEAVRDLGSIAAAGRSMAMSYRRAWLLVEALNSIFEEPVIATRHGGSAGGGASLTPFGHRVIAQYRAMEAKASHMLADDLDALDAATRQRAGERHEDVA